VQSKIVIACVSVLASWGEEQGRTLRHCSAEPIKSSSSIVLKAGQHLFGQGLLCLQVWHDGDRHGAVLAGMA